MIIAKFGGTSVGSKERIETLCEIVSKQQKKTIVVVSAVSGVTDLLLSACVSERTVKKSLKLIREKHEKIIQTLLQTEEKRIATNTYIDTLFATIEILVPKAKKNKATRDTVLASGEMMASFLVCMALEERGIQAAQVVATELIVTNDHFGSAEFLPNQTEVRTRKVLKPFLKKGITPVVTGFIGKTQRGETTTLGRGGSDYTAAILGYALLAEEIQIWTDVDGIFSADPRFVKNAMLLPTVSYKEASEMAWFGAKVLHPRTIRPAVKKGIPVRVLNTFNPDNPGTLIVAHPPERNPITAISCKKRITLVSMYSTDMLLKKGFLEKVFHAFAEHNISIDLVSVSEVSISVTLDNDEHVDAVIQSLSKFSAVTTTRGLGIVSLIGERIAATSLTIASIFSILNKEKILVKMVSLGATDINVSIVIPTQDIDRAIEVLHEKLLVKMKFRHDKLHKKRMLPGTQTLTLHN